MQNTDCKKKFTITVIYGDGIGPEVVEATKMCIEALGLDIKWEKMLAGEPALREKGEVLPEETLDSIRRNKVALKGPIITPVGSGFSSVNVAIRQRLDLYACLRRAKYMEGVNSKYPGVDIVVVRENTEDLYAGIEFKENEKETKELIIRFNQLLNKKIREESALSIKPISEFASKRISRFAFELARKEGRRKVTCVHKANIMKFSDGLFLKSFREVASEFPDIEADDVIVDNLCMQLVLRPEQFDILVLPNLYGDIISDMCAGLVGGLGVAGGANIGEDIAVFEPVHGAAPKYAGKKKVNPTATIKSAIMMLEYLGEREKASILEKALCEVIKEGKFVTYDLKPFRDDPTAVTTFEMAEEIVRKIKAMV